MWQAPDTSSFNERVKRHNLWMLCVGIEHAALMAKFVAQLMIEPDPQARIVSPPLLLRSTQVLMWQPAWARRVQWVEDEKQALEFRETRDLEPKLKEEGQARSIDDEANLVRDVASGDQV